jgi:hypothetical protein
MLRTFRLLSEKTKLFAKVLLKFQYFLAVLGFFSINLWTVAAFIQRPDISYVLVKVQHAANVVLHSIAVISALFLLSRYQNDLQQVVDRPTTFPTGVCKLSLLQ